MAQENNFCFPLKVLENERLKLEPFNRAKYADTFYHGVREHPDLWKHMPSGPFTSDQDFIDRLLVNVIDKYPSLVLFSVLVKSQTDGPQEEQLAGLIGYLGTNVVDAVTEIGWITILPSYQRTFVATNACGLLLLYALDPPSKGGLGLRRVQWQANSANEPSIRLAKRLGFTMEGIIRWQRTLPEEKIGNGVEVAELEKAERHAEGGVQRPGRHSAMLSMCWDDWLIDGKREEVLKMMKRTS